MSDFTGERLVPGEVDADLWNEHISRYYFAAALCANRKRVLDAGCGTGYGVSLLNRLSSAAVLGIDLSADAIHHARETYAAPGAQFAVGRCETLPVRAGSVDVIAAFEVIEHLDAWREFLLESSRALTTDGLLLVSTPNRAVYAEVRGEAGPNPFHVHEFDFLEFSSELAKVFPFVRIFGQNHTGSITLTALGETAFTVERESLHVTPEVAGYFLAVCGKSELPPIPNFVFLPEAANTLLERDRHIRLMTREIGEANKEFAALLEKHRALTADLQASNTWAESLNRDLQDSGERIRRLQTEVVSSNAWAASLDRVIAVERARAAVQAAELHQAQARVVELQAEVESRNEWALNVSRESEERGARVVALQQELETRTRWAQTLDAELAQARMRLQGALDRLTTFEQSRWVKLGKTLQVGPLAQ